MAKTDVDLDQIEAELDTPAKDTPKKPKMNKGVPDGAECNRRRTRRTRLAFRDLRTLLHWPMLVMHGRTRRLNWM